MAGLVVLVLSNPVFAAQRAEHDVAWYRSHSQERQRLLSICANDHSFDDEADCRNATSASHAALGDSFLNGTAAKQEPEATVAYYGHDAGVIAMTLSACSLHQAPLSWCRAAQTAQANLKH